MMRNAAALNNMHAVSLSGRFYYYAQVCFAGLYFACLYFACLNTSGRSQTPTPDF